MSWRQPAIDNGSETNTDLSHPRGGFWCDLAVPSADQPSILNLAQFAVRVTGSMSDVLKECNLLSTRYELPIEYSTLGAFFAGSQGPAEEQIENTSCNSHAVFAQDLAEIAWGTGTENKKPGVEL